MSTKYCQHCGEIIDMECVVCPKCGKQVKELTTNQGQGMSPNVVINNSSNANAYANAGAGFGNVAVSPKSKVVALILAIFFGYLGVHRFYVGKIGTGLVWLFTGSICGLGWIYDIIKIATGTFRDGAGRVISQ